MKPFGRMASLLLGLCAASTLAATDQIPEYAMKAAYLYNFSLFTEWPGPSSGALNLCVLGDDPFGHALEDLAGKPVNGRRLAVHHISGPAEARGCDVLYFGELERFQMKYLKNELGRQPILTISDAENLPHDSAMIVMSTEGHRVTFQVNAEPVHRAGLILSSKLLRFATAVNRP